MVTRDRLVPHGDTGPIAEDDVVIATAERPEFPMFPVEGQSIEGAPKGIKFRWVGLGTMKDDEVSSWTVPKPNHEGPTFPPTGSRTWLTSQRRWLVIVC